MCFRGEFSFRLCLFLWNVFPGPAIHSQDNIPDVFSFSPLKISLSCNNVLLGFNDGVGWAH